MIYNTYKLYASGPNKVNDNVVQEQDVNLRTSGWIDGVFDPASGDGSVGPLVCASREIPQHIKGKKTELFVISVDGRKM